MASRRNEGWRGPCETSIDIEKHSGQPLIVKCGKAGTWHKGGPHGTVLCPEHAYLAERFAQQWQRAAEMMAKARKIRKAAKDANNRA